MTPAGRGTPVKAGAEVAPALDFVQPLLHDTATEKMTPAARARYRRRR